MEKTATPLCAECGQAVLPGEPSTAFFPEPDEDEDVQGHAIFIVHAECFDAFKARVEVPDG